MDTICTVFHRTVPPTVALWHTNHEQAVSVWCAPCSSSSSSCHQTCVLHLSTHLFAISLKLLRSSNEQGSARRVHCIMCAVFSVAIPHSHVASPSKYPHFCLITTLNTMLLLIIHYSNLIFSIMIHSIARNKFI